MWLLKGPQGELIYLKANSTIIVGRNQGDIILREDKSISRKHASVTVQSMQDELKSKCIVKDLESKYGSMIDRNMEQIPVTTEGITVINHDKIKFGLQENEYIVVYIPVVVLISSFNDIEYLQSIMNQLDGYIVQTWTKKVTHLTTPKAILCEKIALALVNCIPILGIEYWEAVLNAIKNNREWPKSTEYILPIAENIIDKEKVSLKPNLERKTLFKNLTFVFFSLSQYQIYHKIIKGAAGKVLMFDASVQIDLTELCDGDYIVVYYMFGSSQTEESLLESQRLKTSYEEIEELLRKKKRRMISDTEILLAILHVSVKEHCNPKHNYKELLLESVKNFSKNNKEAHVFALDTQDLRASSVSRSGVKSSSLRSSGNIIAETFEMKSQDIQKSQKESQFSRDESHVQDQPSTCRSACISSICGDSQHSTQSTGEIGSVFENLAVNLKHSEKRSLETFSFLPMKKPKLDAANLLFPVLPKSKSQDKVSRFMQGTQSIQGSQNLGDSQNVENSQLSDVSSIPILFSQNKKRSSRLQNMDAEPSASTDSGERTKSKNIFSVWSENMKENEDDRNKCPSKTRNEFDTQRTGVKTPPKKSNKIFNDPDDCVLIDSGSETKKKVTEVRHQFNSETKRRANCFKEWNNICSGPEEKKKQTKVTNNSSKDVLVVPAGRSDKRKRDGAAGDSDNNEIIRRKKQKKILHSSDHSQSEHEDLTPLSESQKFRFVQGLIREECHDSLLERTFGHKKFHKIYNSVPRVRIKLDDMISFESDSFVNSESRAELLT